MKRVSIIILWLAFFGLSIGALRAQTWNIGTPTASAVTATLSGGTLTISGTGAMMNWTMGSDAPWGTLRANITTVVIGNGITSIGDYAFYACDSVTSMAIGTDVISIGEYAFAGCSTLPLLIIPNSIISIGVNAFYYCIGLTSITIPASVASIGSQAFARCSGLAAINVDTANLTYSSNTGILYDKNQNLLIGCPTGKTGTITIPTTVTSIGNNAFSYCDRVTSIIINNLVTSIGASAFSYCTNLISITLPNSVVSIGDAAFFNCSNLTTINIGNMVTSISDYLFFGCSKLNSITVSASIISIGEWAFYSCTDLNTIAIPNSVTSIGENAFRNCSGLTSVTIPHSVISIGNFAFETCIGLTLITLKTAVPPQIYSGTFSGVPVATPLHVPCGKQSIYQGAQYWNAFTNIIEDIIPDLTVQSTDLIRGIVAIAQPNTCANNTAIIVATPNTGCRFVQWNDGDITNPRTITVTHDTTFVAIFTAVYYVNLTVNDTMMGTVSGAGIYDQDSIATLTATANTGYHFVQWNDGNTNNPRTLTVTHDTTFTAEFAVGDAIADVLPNTITVYPNPVSNYLTIESDGYIIYSAQIADLTGKTVLATPAIINNTINVSSLSAGVYFVKIETIKGIVTKKFVKK